MLYPYQCKRCDKEVTVSKEMKDCNREEKCDKCGTIMQRVFKLFGIKTSDGIK